MLLNFIRDRVGRCRPGADAERASWLVVAAAEVLAERQADPVERVRYEEAGRRLLLAVRSPGRDVASLREASPWAVGPDGSERPIVELVARHGADSEAGLLAALSLFRGTEWRAAY